jgi:E3 ubiquitin-protein ligase ATL7/58/59
MATYQQLIGQIEETVFKETECAICMADYKGNDIIKSFYKCNHIFHKKCLLDCLKKNNKCPICNHDLSEDIK